MPIKEESAVPNSGKQHPVPQNVMDVEFKVVGDLTVRQLMYVGVGIAVVYIIHRSGLQAFWRIIFMTIVGGTSIAVAFIPYQERGLDKWLVAFIKALTMPTQLVWRKTYNAPAYFISDYAQIIKNEIITLTPAKSRSKLDDYLGQLPEDITEVDRIELTRLTSIQNSMAASKVSVAPVSPGESINYVARPALNTYAADVDVVVEEPPEPPEIPPPTPAPKKTERSKQQAQKPVVPPPMQKPSVQQSRNIPTPVQQKQIQKSEIAAKQEFMEAVSIPVKKPVMSAPLVDRPLINVPSELRGEIKIKTTTKLPKVIVMQDIKDVATKEESLEKKITELMDITMKMKETFAQQVQSGQTQPDQPDIERIEFFKDKYAELQKEQAAINTQIQKNTDQVNKIEHNEEKQKLQDQVTQLTNANKQLQDQLSKISQELERLSDPNKFTLHLQQVQQAQQQQTQTQPRPIQIQPQAQAPQAPAPEVNVQTSPTPNIPKAKDFGIDAASGSTANMIYGTVKDKNGQLIESAVVIIKDEDGDAVRALKTNKLGQFKTQTSMQNGKYDIQVIKGGQKFDIISVNADGKPLNPIYFIGYE